MIYGLYLSATGVLTNAHRQDVIANNLANSETVGFKRDLAMFQQRRLPTQERGFPLRAADPLSGLPPGALVSPTRVDVTQGDMEHTGSNMDVAVEGRGFLAVSDGGQTRLTRNGQLMLDRAGYLVLSANGEKVLDVNRQPITLDPTSTISIAEDGFVTQNGRTAARLGLFDVADPALLRKKGGTLLDPGAAPLQPAAGRLRSQFVERANVDPTVELAAMMDAQRLLEANANMIRYQDQTLGKLVNEVGRIG
jgi:flagellar basal-body rod protein FlgF